MSVDIALGIALAVVLAAVAIWSVAYVRLRRRVRELDRENSRRQGEIESRMNLWQEKEGLRRRFAARQPGDAPPASRPGKHALPRGPTEDRPGRDVVPDGRTRAIDAVLQPIREALQRGERRLQQRARDRREAFANLSARLHGTATADSPPRGGAETTESCGMTPLRLVDLAGVGAHCVHHAPASAGAGREHGPELTIELPDGGILAVDGGPPLDDWVAALQVAEAAGRRDGMARYARRVRDRLERVSGQDYRQRSGAPTAFVVLFLPGEQQLEAVLANDPELREDAWRAGVILATPASLLELLRTVAIGWHRQGIADNAERMRTESGELIDRITHLGERLAHPDAHDPAHPCGDETGKNHEETGKNHEETGKNHE